ncbi:MAG: hypothetical protein HFG29_02550 [Eubacterium sp.]|nr:hypothetical protein [Eubacterium sp.]
MKMWKKIVASLLVLTLVIATLNYVPSKTQASQNDVQNYDWSSVSFLGNGSGNQSYTDVFKIAVGQGNPEIVNIQNPGFASEAGIYVTFSDADFGEITINDKATTAFDKQGAGVIFHVSAFKEQYNSLVVKNSAGSVKAELYVYNKNGTSTEKPTETPDPTEPVNPGVVAAPVKVAGYNFYAQEKGYQITFTPVEEAVSYNVYLDNSEILKTVTQSGEYIDASVLHQYADGELHNLYLQSVDAQGNVSVKSEAAKIRVMQETSAASDPADISRIYVVTNDGTKGGSDIIKATKTPASLTIISNDGQINTVNDGGTIKLRGNSTSLAAKKAYNISFNSKKEVMKGKSKGKKWCLLANAYEKTLMRNKLAMDLGAAIGGIAVPEEHYAELYIDGKLMGNYVISEPAENGRSGCEYNDEDTSDELLFEWEDNDKNEDDCLYFKTPVTGVRFVTEDTVDTSSSRYQKWVSTLTTFENALTNTSSDEVLQYMDVDSFVSMYIVNELFQTVDFGYSSVKFYITYDVNGAPTIHAGPLWDFDLSSGNSIAPEYRTYNTFMGQEKNKWFHYLMKNATFKNKVIEKYKEVQPKIQNIYKDNQLGKSQIQKNIDIMGESRVRNYAAVSQGGAGWSESVADTYEQTGWQYSYSTVSPYNTYTYEQHIAYLTTWMQNRNEWICSQWEINPADYEGEYTGDIISQDIDITGYQISTSYNGIDGNMGFRTIYQAESVVEGKEVLELGIIYGLVYGDNPINKQDVVYGSENEFVKSYVTTDAGKIGAVMGTSKTAEYYARTMECSDSLSNEAYTAQYYIRVYAKLSDGSIVYSDVKTYTVYKVADYIYQKNLTPRKSAYDYIYNKILKKVDNTYKEGDFNWNSTIVK